MRVVVVEDSRAMRMIMGRTLRGIGFEVVEASDLRAGLEWMQQVPTPALALVACNIPEQDGFDFVRAVRADQTLDGVRLMMATTEAELDQAATALEAGADDYVMKPFTRDVIRDKLVRLGLVEQSQRLG
jgi:two-component system chemotaxis response regulator CheY